LTSIFFSFCLAGLFFGERALHRWGKLGMVSLVLGLIGAFLISGSAVIYRTNNQNQQIRDEETNFYPQTGFVSEPSGNSSGYFANPLRPRRFEDAGSLESSTLFVVS